MHLFSDSPKQQRPDLLGWAAAGICVSHGMREQLKTLIETNAL